MEQHTLESMMIPLFLEEYDDKPHCYAHEFHSMDFIEPQNLTREKLAVVNDLDDYGAMITFVETKIDAVNFFADQRLASGYSCCGRRSLLTAIFFGENFKFHQINIMRPTESNHFRSILLIGLEEYESEVEREMGINMFQVVAPMFIGNLDNERLINEVHENWSGFKKYS